MTDTQEEFLEAFKETDEETSKSDVRDKIIRKTTFELEGITYTVLLNKMFHWGAMQQLGQVKYFNNVQVFEHVDGDDECIPYQIGMSDDLLQEKGFMSEQLKREFRKNLRDMELDDSDIKYAKSRFDMMANRFNMTLTDREEV